MAETKTRPKPKGAKKPAAKKSAAKKPKPKAAKVTQIEGRFEMTSVDDFELWPGNARLSDMDNLKESIRINGFITPIVVQEETSRVVVGNHRLVAARELGIEVVPVRVVDIDDEAAERFVLADNAASDKGSYDEVKLGDQLGKLLAQGEDALAGTGYSTKEAKDWVAAAEWGSDDDDEDGKAIEDESTKVTVGGTKAKKIEGSKTRRQAIEDLGVRTMMLSFKLKQYPIIQDAIEKGLKKFKVDTAVDVVVNALAKAKLLDIEEFRAAAPAEEADDDEDDE